MNIDKVRLLVEDSLNIASESALEDAIILLLKEQDRDTRHACAEAVLDCGETSSTIPMIDRCHAACMNAKAV